MEKPLLNLALYHCYRDSPLPEALPPFAERCVHHLCPPRLALLDARGKVVVIAAYTRRALLSEGGSPNHTTALSNLAPDRILRCLPVPTVHAPRLIRSFVLRHSGPGPLDFFPLLLVAASTEILIFDPALGYLDSLHTINPITHVVDMKDGSHFAVLNNTTGRSLIFQMTRSSSSTKRIVARLVLDETLQSGAVADGVTALGFSYWGGGPHIQVPHRTEGLTLPRTEKKVSFLSLKLQTAAGASRQEEEEEEEQTSSSSSSLTPKDSWSVTGLSFSRETSSATVAEDTFCSLAYRTHKTLTQGGDSSFASSSQLLQLYPDKGLRCVDLLVGKTKIGTVNAVQVRDACAVIDEYTTPNESGGGGEAEVKRASVLLLGTDHMPARLRRTWGGDSSGNSFLATVCVERRDGGGFGVPPINSEEVGQQQQKFLDPMSIDDDDITSSPAPTAMPVGSSTNHRRRNDDEEGGDSNNYSISTLWYPPSTEALRQLNGQMHLVSLCVLPQ